MDTSFAIPPSVILPEHGKVVSAFGDTATFLLTGAETGGRYTMFINVTDPGCGPPPHKHDGEDEWFHVLEGSAEFYKDGEWITVPVGASIFMPRGSIHTFRNAGDTPLRQLIHTAPSGFETFFTRCSMEFAREGGCDMEAVVRISAEHGIAYV